MSAPSGSSLFVSSRRDVPGAGSDQALAALVELNSTLLDETSDLVLLLDAESRITQVNRACQCALRRPAEGFAGLLFADLFAPGADRDRAELASREVATGRGRSRLDASMVGCESGDCFIEWRLTPLRASAERPAVLALGVDATGRLRAALELRLHDELLQRSAGLEPFGRRASRLAHDYNNALTALLGFADLLHLRLAANPDAQGDLDELRAAAENAATLTAQLRALAAEVVPRA